MFDIIGHVHQADAGEFAQALGELGGVGLALGRPVRHTLELDTADDGLHFHHAPVGAEALVQPAKTRRVFAVVNGIVAFAVVFISPHFQPQCFIVGGDHAAFAAGGHDFVLAKRPSAHMADGADGAAFIAGTVRLGAIFNHPQLMFFGQRHNGIHLSGHAGQMHHDNGFGGGG